MTSPTANKLAQIHGNVPVKNIPLRVASHPSWSEMLGNDSVDLRQRNAWTADSGRKLDPDIRHGQSLAVSLLARAEPEDSARPN